MPQPAWLLLGAGGRPRLSPPTRACLPPACTRSTPGGMQFRLLLWDGEAYITSGGLRRYIKDYSWFIQACGGRGVWRCIVLRVVSAARVGLRAWAGPSACLCRCLLLAWGIAGPGLLHDSADP